MNGLGAKTGQVLEGELLSSHFLCGYGKESSDTYSFAGKYRQIQENGRDYRP